MSTSSLHRTASDPKEHASLLPKRAGLEPTKTTSQLEREIQHTIAKKHAAEIESLQKKTAQHAEKLPELEGLLRIQIANYGALEAKVNELVAKDFEARTNPPPKKSRCCC